MNNKKLVETAYTIYTYDNNDKEYTLSFDTKENMQKFVNIFSNWSNIENYFYDKEIFPSNIKNYIREFNYLEDSTDGKFSKPNNMYLYEIFLEDYLLYSKVEYSKFGCSLKEGLKYLLAYFMKNSKESYLTLKRLRDRFAATLKDISEYEFEYYVPRDEYNLDKNSNDFTFYLIHDLNTDKFYQIDELYLVCYEMKNFNKNALMNYILVSDHRVKDKDLAKKMLKKLKENNKHKDVEEKKMSYGSVKVVPKSAKYTRDDIEKVLSEAYENENLVLDFKKEDDEYVYLYLRERKIDEA